jgi:hypothetical protein
MYQPCNFPALALTFVAFVVAALTRWDFEKPVALADAARFEVTVPLTGCVTALPSTFSAFAADTVAR